MCKITSRIHFCVILWRLALIPIRSNLNTFGSMLQYHVVDAVLVDVRVVTVLLHCLLSRRLWIKTGITTLIRINQRLKLVWIHTIILAHIQILILLGYRRLLLAGAVAT